MRILHIAPDEKFVDSVIYQFEKVAPNASDYIVFLNEGQSNVSFVKNLDKIQIKSRTNFEFEWILKRESKYDLICFHSIDNDQAQIILKLQNKTKILWFLFGYEVYHNPNIVKEKSILGNVTYNYFYKKSIFQKDFYKSYFFKNRFRAPKQVIESLLYGKHYLFKLSKTAMKKVDYLGVPFYEELNYISEKLNKKFINFNFSYYPIEFILKKPLEISGDNILIGNSSTISNNHLDVFEKLKDFNLKDKRLIVPLNYGDFNYRSYIVKEGYELFSNSFKPLMEFLSLEEYNKHISSCNIAIMGHIRQQSVGNIITMLCMGAKVFLSQENTVYKFLKRLGIKIFTIEDDLNANNKGVFDGLSFEDKQRNLEILKNEVGEDVLMMNLRKQIENVVYGD